MWYWRCIGELDGGGGGGGGVALYCGALYCDAVAENGV
jgi:hypothetical protein